MSTGACVQTITRVRKNLASLLASDSRLSMPRRLAKRAAVLANAFSTNPERFVQRAPSPSSPTAAWINKPT